MWVRKRIEVSGGDLARGLGFCFAAGNREQTTQKIVDLWQTNEHLVCLSVRSGFDMLLHSLSNQQSDSCHGEIIMSGLTIPDMPKIVKANNMIPVGVDVDLDTLGPNLDDLRSRINKNTRAIVVAHLLGGLCELGPIIELAREHNLLVIEDCAQAYTCLDYQGDSRADVSMFSFGPIKTNTALGGGVFRVRNQHLRESMQRVQDSWKFQTRFSFARRISKYAFVKTLSTRLACGSFYRLMKLFGKDHDGIASRMARGFAGPGFFERIRRQPSQPLLRLLYRKLTTYDPDSTEKRRRLAESFVERVGPDVYVLGSMMQRQTYWVLPVLAKEPKQLVQKLWDAGFDASNSCSLHSVCEDSDTVAAKLLEHIVFLPLHCDIPQKHVLRMADVVRDAKPAIPELVDHWQEFAEQRRMNSKVATVESLDNTNSAPSMV